MFRRSGRYAAIVVGAVALVVVGALAQLLLPLRQSADVAVPANDASPERVVKAYLDALNAHDCDTAEALMTGGAADGAES